VGWSIEDSVLFAKALAERGVDAIDCSSGGMRLSRDQQLVSRTPGFQVPFASRIRREAGVPTIAVGLIREPKQAEAVLRAGDADLIALGREALFNPNFPAQAALELTGDEGWQLWPEQYRWWLERRARATRNG
jgi:2,4-dienoyl-CoA reductase-like NADH-dependent reductase (Old Yellow Enzyme family)